MLAETPKITSLKLSRSGNEDGSQAVGQYRKTLLYMLKALVTSEAV